MSISRRSFLAGGILALAGGPLSNIAAAASPDITHGPRSVPKVALTFHGAGDLTIAHSLLDILKATSTPVSVFAVGTFLMSEPAIAKRIISDGHDLGNHTMTHTQMKTISAKKVDAEILGCANELKKLIGNHGSWFRPSGTQYSTALIRKTALKYGYKNCISYDVDSHDYQDPGKAAVISNVMSSVKNGSIISLHFGHKNTIDALASLLDQLHSKGLTPVTLTNLLGKI
ncbi:MAG: polysaccharide deacetylase family protein [Actinobacteria bacterium]|jgi:peptidoglycan/xylan/chitin deacetylase (PgdA/CDA1 family)|nr:polysaccharide deacetylase family protein [Actinomycetota bacterium]